MSEPSRSLPSSDVRTRNREAGGCDGPVGGGRADACSGVAREKVLFERSVAAEIGTVAVPGAAAAVAGVAGKTVGHGGVGIGELRGEGWEMGAERRM